MNNVVKLEPFYKKAVWGSESWLASTHQNGESLVDKKTLGFNLPYLIKKISTHKDLSVQVHPSGVNSKNESWLITGHTEGAGIYLGFKEGTTKARFEDALENKEDISSFLNFIPVKNGDFFFIPTGAIHAIGKGIELIEVQECSDTTYRVWDWNRNGLDGKPRQLHTTEAISCLDFDFTEPVCLNLKEMKSTKQEVINFSGINIELLSLKNDESYSCEFPFKTSFVLISGDVDLNNKKMNYESSLLSTANCKVEILSRECSKVFIIRYRNE